jgi:Flp pilus assembly protein TadB
VETEPVL